MTKLTIRLKGSSSSGHYGHSGRPGKTGGSSPGKGGKGANKFTVHRDDQGYQVKRGNTLAHTFQRHATAKRYAAMLSRTDNPVSLHTSFIKTLTDNMNTGEYNDVKSAEKAAVNLLESEL